VRVESPTIKSFKLRGTRITAAQIEARDRLWSIFGVAYTSQVLDFSEVFTDRKKIIAEIGFGMGEATIDIARTMPEVGFLAIDVHQPGIGKLLSRIEETGVKNVRVMDEDAHLILGRMVKDQSLDGVHLFFPDPWPKTRHHKRRIVNADFIELLARKLKIGATVHIATDWVPYATWIEERFATSRVFKGGVVARPSWRPLTRFEGQGITKQHQVTDFSYEKL